MLSLHDILRTETTALHDRLDALPFFQALHAGRLPRPAIVSFLCSLTIIHAAMERELAAVTHNQIAALGKQAVPKVPLLVADLESLGAATVPSVTPAIRRAFDYGCEIPVAAADPLALVGMLYVLEGSQKGGLVLKQEYDRCLAPHDAPLSYFGYYGKNTATHWRTFTGLLNALDLEIEQTRTVVRSAIGCFERLSAICAALYPYADGDLKYHDVAINFEAGLHAMPQNPLEIDLALRAGKAAWDKYPYLALRFGERGWRFTSSDSCWLVTLTQVPVEVASKQLEWLRPLLASRGIPTTILAAHLRAITHAFAVDFPEQAERRATFNPFLSALDRERTALLGGEFLSHRLQRFEQRFRGCTGLVVDPAAELIASAWIDDRSGITGALASVRDWFADRERFSADWVATVDALVHDLNQAGGSTC